MTAKLSQLRVGLRQTQLSLRIASSSVLTTILLGALTLDCGQVSSFASQANSKSRFTFFETFDDNSNGWIFYDTAGKVRSLPIWDGTLICFSPWWIDYNHAPPGAGYLHILTGLHTHNTSSWAKQNLKTDFTNAKVTVRLRGDMDMKNTNMLFLAQATNGSTRANYVLTAQPFAITGEWSEQTITLFADPNQWICLGSRHDRTETYGCYDIEDVLSDLNLDFIFVLFPLKIEPVNNEVDKHFLRAGNQYYVKQDLLPSGVIMLDYIMIELAETEGPQGF